MKVQKRGKFLPDLLGGTEWLLWVSGHACNGFFWAVIVTENMLQLPRGGWEMEPLDPQQHKTTIYINTGFHDRIYDSFNPSLPQPVLSEAQAL